MIVPASRWSYNQDGDQVVETTQGSRVVRPEKHVSERHLEHGEVQQGINKRDKTYLLSMKCAAVSQSSKYSC